MSRSYRKTPICGNTKASSDKADKVMAHRRERVAARMAMARDEDAPDYHLISDTWKYAKDGKQWFGDRHPTLLRK